MNHGSIWTVIVVYFLSQTAALTLNDLLIEEDHVLLDCTNKGPSISIRWSARYETISPNESSFQVSFGRILKSNQSPHTACCAFSGEEVDSDIESEPETADDDHERAKRSTYGLCLPEKSENNETDATDDEQADYFSGKVSSAPSLEVVTCEGTELSLTCSVYGDYSLRTSWRHWTADHNFTEIDKSNVFIRHVRRSDAGAYTCEVSDVDKVQEENSSVILREVRIVVEYAPVISVPEPDVYTHPDEECQLHCLIESLPDAQITWYKSGIALDDPNDPRFHASVETTPDCYTWATLLLTTFVPEYNLTQEWNDTFANVTLVYETTADRLGNYSCMARNQYGSTHGFLKLEAAWIPQEMPDTEFRRFNVTGFIIGMLPPLFISFYIILKLGYRSRYAAEGDEDDGGIQPFFVSQLG